MTNNGSTTDCGYAPAHYDFYNLFSITQLILGYLTITTLSFDDLSFNAQSIARCIKRRYIF